MKKQKIEKQTVDVEVLEAELKRVNYGIRFRTLLKSTVYTLIVTAAVAVLIAVFFMSVFRIYGSSMQPTLTEGQIVVSVKSKNVKHGDIVGVWWGSKLLVKRCIATAGETVDIDEEGNVYVNGCLIGEPYLVDRAKGETNIELPFHVPEHTHSDACYDAPPAQSVPYSCCLVEHTHSGSCYDPNGVLICTIPEHSHTERCRKDYAAPRFTASLYAASLGASPTGTKIDNAAGFAGLKNSGTYYLNADITVSNSVTINGANVTLNLNGHNLGYSGSGDFITLNSGSLKIVDNAGLTPTEKTVNDPASYWANTATYSGGTLTYYVTETEIVVSSRKKTEKPT